MRNGWNRGFAACIFRNEETFGKWFVTKSRLTNVTESHFESNCVQGPIPVQQNSQNSRHNFPIYDENIKTRHRYT